MTVLSVLRIVLRSVAADALGAVCACTTTPSLVFIGAPLAMGVIGVTGATGAATTVAACARSGLLGVGSFAAAT